MIRFYQAVRASLAVAATFAYLETNAQTLWGDSVETRAVLADTSRVSPFMPIGSSKRDERSAAVKSYCDCVKLDFLEYRETFNGIIAGWGKMRCRPTSGDLQMIGLGYRGLLCDTLPNVNKFSLLPTVKPLIVAKEVQKMGVSGRFRAFNTSMCNYQTSLMYPAYALKYPLQNKEVAKVDAAMWKLRNAYDSDTLQPWINQRIALGQLKEDAEDVAKDVITTPSNADVRNSVGRLCKYPIIISNIPFSEFSRTDERKLPELIRMLEYHHRVEGNKYHANFAYIDITGKIMQLEADPEAKPYAFGVSEMNRLISAVKYRSKTEVDSFSIKDNAGFPWDFRVVYKTVNFPEGSPYGGIRLRPEKVWFLTNKAGAIVTSYSNFSCVHPNQRESKSYINYIGNGRYWVRKDCEEGKATYLLDANGKIIAQFSPSQRVTFDKGQGAFSINSAPSPRPSVMSKGGRYDNGLLIMDDNTILNVNGKVVYNNPKYRIQQLIDKKVALALVDMPEGQQVYAWVNYRTGKVIYTALDYEKSGFSIPTTAK